MNNSPMILKVKLKVNWNWEGGKVKIYNKDEGKLRGESEKWEHEKVKVTSKMKESWEGESESEQWK